MSDLEVKSDDNGEYVLMPSGGGPNDHVFTKVYLDELGYDPRVPETKCKNCKAPIEHLTKSGYDLGYWRHTRDVHTGRLWCYPTVDIHDGTYVTQAEPEDDSNV